MSLACSIILLKHSKKHNDVFVMSTNGTKRAADAAVDEPPSKRAPCPNIQKEIETFFDETMNKVIMEKKTVASVPCVGLDTGFTTVTTVEKPISRMVLQKDANGKWSVEEISTEENGTTLALKRNAHHDGFTRRRNSKNEVPSSLQVRRGNQHYTIYTNYRGQTWKEDRNS